LALKGPEKGVSKVLRLGVIVVIVGLLTLAVSSIGFAEGEKASAPANPINKLASGLDNALLGWMDIPRQINKVSSYENAFAGMTYGTVKGIAYGTGRTAAGVIDTGTFIFPPYDKPMVEPLHTF